LKAPKINHILNNGINEGKRGEPVVGTTTAVKLAP